jgi:hypothetical protein
MSQTIEGFTYVGSVNGQWIYANGDAQNVRNVVAERIREAYTNLDDDLRTNGDKIEGAVDSVYTSIVTGHECQPPRAPTYIPSGGYKIVERADPYTYGQPFNKLHAIKALRMYSGIGLKDAKDAIERGMGYSADHYVMRDVCEFWANGLANALNNALGYVLYDVEPCDA